MKLLSILMVAFLLAAAVSYNSVACCIGKDTRVPVPTTTTTTTTTIKPPEEESTQVNPRFKDYPKVEQPPMQEEPNDSEEEEEEPVKEVFDYDGEMLKKAADEDLRAEFDANKCVFENGESYCLHGGECVLYLDPPIFLCRCTPNRWGLRCEVEDIVHYPVVRRNKKKQH